MVAQDFDDFFGSEDLGAPIEAPKESGNFDFYDDWDDGEDDLLGIPKKSGKDGMDEEDRRFFEELSKGFSAKDTEDEAAMGNNEEPMERNELMDDTRATRLLAAQRHLDQHDDEEGIAGTIDFEADREESKEDEYDYFMDAHKDENFNSA